jgi:hypothetical protein
MSGEYFSTRKSKLQKATRWALGPAALPYLIVADNGKFKRYALQLPKKTVSYRE